MGLAAHLAQSAHGGRAAQHPLAYLVAPWTVGHTCLYLTAHVVAIGRRRLRLALMPGWNASFASSSDDDDNSGGSSARTAWLRDVFDRFDTSSDGFLDGVELKLALRVVTGEDLSLLECERIVRAVDADGDGVVNFVEFRAAVAQRLQR